MSPSHATRNGHYAVIIRIRNIVYLLVINVNANYLGCDGNFNIILIYNRSNGRLENCPEYIKLIITKIISVVVNYLDLR